MVFVVIAIVLVWKPLKRTRFYRAHEIDFVTGLDEINDYTEDVSCYTCRSGLALTFPC